MTYGMFDTSSTQNTRLQRTNTFAENFEPKTWDTVKASFGEAIATNPINFFDQNPDGGKLLSADEANKRYGGIGDLYFDAEVTEGRANFLQQEKKAELKRMRTIAMGPKGIGPFVAQLGGGLVGSMTDPINIASGFLPSMAAFKISSALGKQAPRWAQMVTNSTRSGTVAQRAVAGLIEGGIGAVMVEPFSYLSAQERKLEYGMNDALMNIAFGTAMGGGTHAIARHLELKSDKLLSKEVEISSRQETEISMAIDKLPLTDKRDLLNASLSQAINDKVVKNMSHLIQNKVLKTMDYNISGIPRTFSNKIVPEVMFSAEKFLGGRNGAVAKVASFSDRRQARAYIGSGGDGKYKKGSLVSVFDEETKTHKVYNTMEDVIVSKDAQSGEVLKFDNKRLAKKYAKKIPDSHVVEYIDETPNGARKVFSVVEGVDKEQARFIQENIDDFAFISKADSGRVRDADIATIHGEAARSGAKTEPLVLQNPDPIKDDIFGFDDAVSREDMLLTQFEQDNVNDIIKQVEQMDADDAGFYRDVVDGYKEEIELYDQVIEELEVEVTASKMMFKCMGY